VFGVVEAVLQILQHPAVMVNEKTKHGSSPLMVAVKYGEKAVVEVLIKDTRTDLGVVDASGRTLYEVIGVATDMIEGSLKLEISEFIKTENNKRSLRKKKKGVHKVLDPGQLIVKQARDKVNKLVSDMEETQRIEMMRFQENLENNSREFTDKQQEEKENFSLKMEEEKNIFIRNQEIQSNRFLSELESCKYVFVKMQEEARQQFVTNEKLSLDQFKQIQAEQRQSFQFYNTGEELAMSRSQQNSMETESNKLHKSLNLNIFPDVSDLVGRNSFSLPASERSSSTDIENQNPCAPSLNFPENEKSIKIWKRKSLPVMGPPQTKELNIDHYTDSQFSQQYPSATVAGWRKTSCPASLAGAVLENRHLQNISPSYPYTPPSSPTTASSFLNPNVYQSLKIPTADVQNTRETSKSSIGSRLSPMQSFSSNTSSNPSPVPSLEYIAPNEMFMRIPDTCPNIKALVNSQEVLIMPFETNSHGTFPLKTPPKSPSVVSCHPGAFPFPDVDSVCLKDNNLVPKSPNFINNITSSFVPIKTTESSPHLSFSRNPQSTIQNQASPKLPQILQDNSPPITKLNFGSPKSSLTPRLARKNAMEVLKEEDDDEDQLVTKDDEEIAELTNTGIIRNKSSSFTNLISNMKSPSPSRSRGSAHPEENKAKIEKTKMFFLEMENDLPGEDIEERKERSKSLPESYAPIQDLKENISKQYSGLSLASSTSTSSFKSAETSPVKEIGCILV